MYKQFYAGMDLIWLPLLAMFLFLATFTIIVVRMLLKRASDFDSLAHLPLTATETARPRAALPHPSEPTP